MLKEEFKNKVEELGLKLSDYQMSQFDTYYKELKTWNEVMNLTAITDEEEVYLKHFYDSLLSVKDVDYIGTLADVGSGAGFPGLVLKIAFPDLEVTLIEPIGKRCKFLNHMIEILKLEKIEVVNKRSEDYIKEKREAFDLVSARAVSNLSILSELCIPFLKVNGKFIILKGSSGNEEIAEAKNAFSKLNTRIEHVSEYKLDEADRIIAIAVKEKKTNIKYPRNYGEIKKKPL